MPPAGRPGRLEEALALPGSGFMDDFAGKFHGVGKLMEVSWWKLVWIYHNLP